MGAEAAMKGAADVKKAADGKAAMKAAADASYQRLNYETEKKSDDDDEIFTSNLLKPSAMEMNSESLTKSDKVSDSTDENKSDDAQSKVLTIASAGTAAVVIASVLIALAIRRKKAGSKTEMKNPVQLPEN